MVASPGYRSERYFLPGAYLLPDHFADFLIRSFSFDPGGDSGFRRDGVCPYPVCLSPHPPCLVHPVEHGTAGLLVKLDRHLAILVTLVKADADNRVSGNDVGVGGS